MGCRINWQSAAIRQHTTVTITALAIFTDGSNSVRSVGRRSGWQQPSDTPSGSERAISGSAWAGETSAPSVEEFLSPEQQVALGVVKGAGQTANTVSKVLNKIPFVGEYLAPKAGIAATEQMEQQHTLGEKIGGGLEGIGEFFLGDEALKGLSLAERAGLLAKVSKLAESNPIIAKIVSHGLNAVRGGVTTGVQQMAHGATPTQALETGATAAGPQAQQYRERTAPVYPQHEQPHKPISGCAEGADFSEWV